MKIMLVFLSFLILLAGILPFLGSSGLNILPEAVPVVTPGYSLIIISIGTIGLIYGIMSHMLFGIEKFVVISLAMMTILGGILPFIASFIWLPIPTSGAVYSGIIILVGILGVVYGVTSL